MAKIRKRARDRKPGYYLFSDGSSFNNGKKKPDLPQHASCGIVITDSEGKTLKERTKFFPDQTISYGELRGSIVALNTFKKYAEKNNLEPPYRIELYSDSQFVVKGVNDWMLGWLKRGWKNASGATVGQVDLWKYLHKNYLTNEDYKIKFVHIKGHTGNDDFFSQMNDRCDHIAGVCMNEELKVRGLK